jgi:hypothetical protein
MASRGDGGQPIAGELAARWGAAVPKRTTAARWSDLRACGGQKHTGMAAHRRWQVEDDGQWCQARHEAGGATELDGDVHGTGAKLAEDEAAPHSVGDVLPTVRCSIAAKLAA